MKDRDPLNKYQNPDGTLVDRDWGDVWTSIVAMVAIQYAYVLEERLHLLERRVNYLEGKDDL